MSLYLGIDVGTSGTKAILCRDDGKVLATAVAEHPASMPRPGWSEQNPADWVASGKAATGAVFSKAGVSPAELRGIGLAGQMHGSVFLDAAGKVLRPALLWNDQRTAEECAEIEAAAGGRARLIQWVSNPAFTGFTAPKILWLRKHEPEHFRRTATVLLPKDYLRYALTGERVTEVSDASGTLLLNVTERAWSEPLLRALRLDPGLLPRCVESAAVTGTVAASAAADWGLPPGVPVVGGGGDQAASAVGLGIVTPGLLSAAIGTSGVIFAHAAQARTEPEGRVHTFCHAVNQAWHLMGVVLSAGGSLQWFRNQLCPEERAREAAGGPDAYDQLLGAAAEVEPGAEGLFFLPYLTGERHPHSDPKARGGFIGLTARHAKAHLTRAVVEGISFALKDCLEVMQSMGCNGSEIRLAGGGARSMHWSQWLADIFGVPTSLTNSTEGPAYGAALLAMVGTGRYPDVPSACAATIKTTRTYEPRAAARDRYAELHRRYQTLYPLLRATFQAIG